MTESHEDNPVDEQLKRLLVEHREAMLRMAGKVGGGLLRHETAEDLVQGAQLHALGVADRFEYVGESAFLGWIRQLIQQHVARRHEYWSAQKRDAGVLLRISAGGDEESEPGGIDISASLTGPATFADRREQILIAMQVLEALSDRDRSIVRCVREGCSTVEIAEELGLGPAAAEKARTRAMNRFKKAFLLLQKRSG